MADPTLVNHADRSKRFVGIGTTVPGTTMDINGAESVRGWPRQHFLQQDKEEFILIRHRIHSWSRKTAGRTQLLEPAGRTIHRRRYDDG